MANSNDQIKIVICEQHADVIRVVVGLLLLDEHPGGATQKEASRVVQLLAQMQANLMCLIRCGVLQAMDVLARAEGPLALNKKQVAAQMLQRFSMDSDCRRMLLKSGGAKTLCLLSRTLARKVVRPALSALCAMALQPSCVTALIEAGAGKVLSSLASSSDPELRQEGCKALADLLESSGGTTLADDQLRMADQLLNQGALPVFFAACYSPDRVTQLHASRGILHFASTSPVHARIIARKGAARPLCALLHGREHVLTNAIHALYEISHAVAHASSHKEPGLTKNRLAKVRGVLEVGVVGTPKELWVRLNDDEGRPAAKLMAVARSGDFELREKAQSILRLLKPDALGLVEDDLHDTGKAAVAHDKEKVADRHCKLKSIIRIQKRFIDMRRRVGHNTPMMDKMAAEAEERRRRLGFAPVGAGAPQAAPLRPRTRDDSGRVAQTLMAAVVADKWSKMGSVRQMKERGSAAVRPQSASTRGLPVRDLNALNQAVAAGIGGAMSPNTAARFEGNFEKPSSPHAEHVRRQAAKGMAPAMIDGRRASFAPSEAPAASRVSLSGALSLDKPKKAAAAGAPASATPRPPDAPRPSVARPQSARN